MSLTSWNTRSGREKEIFFLRLDSFLVMVYLIMPKHPTSRRASPNVPSPGHRGLGEGGSSRDGPLRQNGTLPAAITASKNLPQQLTGTESTARGGDASRDGVPKKLSAASISSLLLRETQSNPTGGGGVAPLACCPPEDAGRNGTASCMANNASTDSTRGGSSSRASNKNDSPTGTTSGAVVPPGPVNPANDWVSVTSGSRHGRGGGGGRSWNQKKHNTPAAAAGSGGSSATTATSGGGGGGGAGGGGGGGGMKHVLTSGGQKTGAGVLGASTQATNNQQVPDFLLSSAFPPLTAAAVSSLSSPPGDGGKVASARSKSDCGGGDETEIPVNAQFFSSSDERPAFSEMNEALPTNQGGLRDSSLARDAQPPPPEREANVGTMVVAGGSEGESFSTAAQPACLQRERVEDPSRLPCPPRPPPYLSSSSSVWGGAEGSGGGGGHLLLL